MTSDHKIEEKEIPSRDALLVAFIEDHRAKCKFTKAQFSKELEITPETYSRYLSNRRINPDKASLAFGVLGLKWEEFEKYLEGYLPAPIVDTAIVPPENRHNQVVSGVPHVKPYNWLRLSLFIIPGLVFSIALTYFIKAQYTQKVSIEIPRSGDTLSRTTTIAGTYKALAKNQQIWVYIYAPEDRNGTYYARKALTVPSGSDSTQGKWSIHDFLIGSTKSTDSGKQFTIGVLVADSIGSQSLEKMSEFGGSLPSEGIKKGPEFFIYRN